VTVGSRRQILETLRDQLIDECSQAVGKDLAPLARELRQVVAELDGIPDATAKAPTDEIAARRDERRRKAAGE
jgi:hypothetical protein